MAEPSLSPFTRNLLTQAMQPQTQVPFRPATPVAQTQPNPFEQRRQAAFAAALTNPNRAIAPEFSTGSPLIDEQERERARLTLMQ